MCRPHHPLPTCATELAAWPGEAAADIATSLQTLAPLPAAVLATALGSIEGQALASAAVLLAEADPDEAHLPELLTARAWLLAVAAGAHWLAPSDPAARWAQVTQPAVDRLREGYQDDLAAAQRDQVLCQIDDLLLP